MKTGDLVEMCPPEGGHIKFYRTSESLGRRMADGLFRAREFVTVTNSAVPGIKVVTSKETTQESDEITMTTMLIQEVLCNFVEVLSSHGLVYVREDSFA